MLFDYQMVTFEEIIKIDFFKWTQSIRFHIRYFLDLLLSMCSYEKVFFMKKVSKYHFFAERKDK